MPALLLTLALVACNSPTGPDISGITLSVNPPGVPAGGGTIVVEALVIGTSGNPLGDVKVAFVTNNGTLSASAAATDSEGKARVQLTANGPATVTARSEAVEARLDVAVDVQLALEINPAEPRRGELITIQVTPTSGGQAVSGHLVLDLGDGTTRDFGQIQGTVTTTHVYNTDGTFSISATFTSGSLESKKTTPVAVAGFAPGADQIDPKSIIWLSPATTNISDWPPTSRVTNVSVAPPTVCIDHEKAGQWPLVSIDNNPPNIEANILIVVNVGGQWYGGGFDWLGQGRTCKTVDPSEYGRDQIRVPPLDGSWHGPRSGEEVGLLISTPSSNRIPVRSVNERTNIVLVRWP
jgi:hypothetical protein